MLGVTGDVELRLYIPVVHSFTRAGSGKVIKPYTVHCAQVADFPPLIYMKAVS
jgi:hypothetical protein